MENKNSQTLIKEDLVLKEITEQNLTTQNQFLVDNGFKKLKRNLRFLLKYEKNQEKALAALKEKKLSCKTPKNDKKAKKWQERIEKNGHQEQNAFLISKGYNNIHKNCKKLEKFNGDKEKALEALIRLDEKLKKTKNAEKEKKDKLSIEEIDKLGYSTQNEGLFSKGFTKPKLNLKVLVKTKGIFEAALKLIQKKCEKKMLRKLLKDNISSDSWDKKKLDPEIKQKLTEELKTWVLQEIMPNTKIVYLDGVNIFFTNTNIRNLCLQQKAKEAESIISQLAIEFGKLFGIEQLVLVYDKTNNPSNTEIGSQKFSVCSASPNFKTSEEALVEWIGGLNQLDNVLVVTSDLGLQVKLKDKGVKMIMKTGVWFSIIKTKIGKENYKKIMPKGKIENEMKNLKINK